MVPTLIGIVVTLAGLLVLVLGSSAAMLSMVMLCSLMSGSAALVLPALGNSSIPPLQLAIVFLVIRLLLPSDGSVRRLSDSIRANQLMLIYVAYGVAGAYVLPRIFAGALQVAPLRFTGLTYIYATVPLAPSSQNVTTTVYLVGTVLTAICAHAAIKTDRGATYFVRTAIVLGLVHVGFGIASVALKGTSFDAVQGFFRNASYAQLDQSYGGFIRVTGISPEPSGYASYAFAWFVFLFECWVRGINSKWTGLASGCLGLILVFSTSGLAYVGLAIYTSILLVRFLVPGNALSYRMVYLLGVLVLITTAIAAVFLAAPSLAANFTDMFYHMTVDKGSSQSGLQRAFWAKKGLEAFVVSHGLGVGPGSFRSSSLGTAVLGSLGVVGAVTFIAYIIYVLKPLRASTYVRLRDTRTALGAAASWAAFCCLIPGMVGAPSADPGSVFAIFAGVALALRVSRPDELANISSSQVVGAR